MKGQLHNQAKVALTSSSSTLIAWSRCIVFSFFFPFLIVVLFLSPKVRATVLRRLQLRRRPSCSLESQERGSERVAEREAPVAAWAWEQTGALGQRLVSVGWGVEVG